MKTTTIAKFLAPGLLLIAAVLVLGSAEAAHVPILDYECRSSVEIGGIYVPGSAVNSGCPYAGTTTMQVGESMSFYNNDPTTDRPVSVRSLSNGALEFSDTCVEKDPDPHSPVTDDPYALDGTHYWTPTVEGFYLVLWGSECPLPDNLRPWQAIVVEVGNALGSVSLNGNAICYNTPSLFQITQICGGEMEWDNRTCYGIWQRTGNQIDYEMVCEEEGSHYVCQGTIYMVGGDGYEECAGQDPDQNGEPGCWEEHYVDQGTEAEHGRTNRNKTPKPCPEVVG